MTSESGFLALREQWDALLASSRAPSIFLTWEWLYTWWRHLARDASLRLLVLRDGEQVAAIAPCLVRPISLARLQLMPVLQFLGAGEVGSDYLDVIVRKGDEAAALAALGRHLSKRSWQLEFPAMRGDAHGQQLALALEERGWHASSSVHDVCPFIPMAGSTWDRYLAGVGREHRSNFRRRLRRLQQTHSTRFTRVTTEPERAAALATLVRLHNERWARRGGSTAFHSPRLIEFHGDFTALALRRGWLRLYLLWVDELPAAALYGFAYGGKFYFYQAGFDMRFAPLSVGLVTMGLTIQEAFAEGLDEYDFLHGAEDYKFLWARDARPLCRVDLYPPEVRGVICQAAAASYWNARRLARKLVETGRQTIGVSTREVARVRPSVVVPSAR